MSSRSDRTDRTDRTEASSIERGAWRLGSGEHELLVVDNYDSFTFNLVQCLVTFGVAVEVRRNDAASAEELLQGGWLAIVLSPGPGRPENAGVCVDLLRLRREIPILGVCLGHQALGYAFGAEIVAAPTLMHGKTSHIRIESNSLDSRGLESSGPDPLFRGLEQGFDATRYHSLCVAPDSLPDELLPLAWTEDGTLMAMRHRELPYWGVQFHPESILTEAGPRMLESFVELARERRVAA